MESSSLIEQNISEGIISDKLDELEVEQNENGGMINDEPDKLETEQNNSDKIINDESDKPRESKPFSTMIDLYHVVNTLIPYPETDIVESVDFIYQGSEIVKKKIQLQRIDKEKRPRTIVCHDMKGGYLEDR